MRTSREARYKAKAAIDTFFWRAGDMLQAGIVLMGSRLACTTADFAAVTMALASVWIGVVALLYREYGPSGEPAPKPVPSPVLKRRVPTTAMLLRGPRFVS
jgi:ATP/ADP translocase